MNAVPPLEAPAHATFISADGTTSIEVRHAIHPDAAKHFATDELRAHFLIDSLFRPDAVSLVYSHIDRIVVGGALPIAAPLALQSPKPIGSPTFLARRELGVINLGTSGRVVVDGESFELARCDSLYVGRGTRDVRFESIDARQPARFYLLSTPAHAAHPTRKLAASEAKMIRLGKPETANVRTIHQVIHPDVCASCQLVMGFTVLEPGSVWNTMPSHLHDRRCEVYLYFDVPADARVFHLMGEPTETRHIVVANEQAVLSPGWSIHSGAGTASYAFVWAMAGDNQDFGDMDAVGMGELR
jgi:4-deoxy-L-threo-5-hexosulose-uronate ketol-isomerase